MNMMLNPDKEKVKKVREGLKANDGYCPCMVEKNENTKCPCLPCRTEDKCICGLFVVKSIK